MKGRRRWIRNSTEFKRQWALGISTATIDLILRRIAYRLVSVPDKWRPNHKLWWLIQDPDGWYNQPVDLYHMVIGMYEADQSIGKRFCDWMNEMGLWSGPMKR